MITPRRTRLVRVADLDQFRRAIRALADDGYDDRARLVLVPSRGAADALGLPGAVTREELYEQLHARLPAGPSRLTPFDREAIVRAAAREAIATGAAPPFHLRPGLIAEVVRFYDQLRRQRQDVARFDELLVESVSRDIDLDRGAERMLRQTRFLACVYRAYEERVAAGGHVDEHALRARLAETVSDNPVRHVIVTVGDWIADSSGLYPADFDLLTRLPSLDAIDIVATEELLASGFHQRLRDWLPGIEELGGAGLGLEPRKARPDLLATSGAPERPLFVYRDREEELIAIARCAAAAGPGAGSTGVVYQRPLPYLYLAPEVFRAADVRYRTADALPLAAEPFVAAVDVVLEFVASQFTREAIVALVRSPHLSLAREGLPVTRNAIAALDRSLTEARYLGELDRLRQLAQDWPGAAAAVPALGAALDAAETLSPLLLPDRSSVQLARLLTFFESRTRSLEGDARQSRARGAVAGILQSLAAAHAAHDDQDATIEELAPQIRRWIEEATMAPVETEASVHLLDAQAARYADLDALVIVGLIEGEWPERPRRNIFYPPALLAALGWPSEHDRRGAASAAFVDLLGSPAATVALSTFTLDDDALVEPSSLIDETGRAGLQRAASDDLSLSPSATQGTRDAQGRGGSRTAPPACSLNDETLAVEPAAREWASFRMGRTAGDDARYHGGAGPQPRVPQSVSAVETYLSCPFKFFAQRVLRLEEEVEDEEVMDPKKQGKFIHEVFERFFRTWQARGYRAITPGTLDEARRMFQEVADERLRHLPEAEAALERTRLIGSSVAPGLADIVFRMEAERPVEVVERLLEYRLDGEFELAGPDGPRRVALRGVADRLDLLADGTFRLIDYKLSSAPNKSRALQLPIYGLTAEQKLASHPGGPWTLGEASYIAFRGARKVIPLFTARAERADVLSAAQEKLLDALGAIERGEFPPTPTDIFICNFCGYGSVCRKDYVGDV